MFPRCDLCGISVNTREQLSIHQLGKQHQKKLKTAQFLQSVGGNSSESRNGMDTDHAVSQLSSRVSAMSLSFNCELCDITCNTVGQLELHKAGSQHQRKLANRCPKSVPPDDKYEVKQVGGVTQFHCSICPNTWCPTLSELENHRRGTNHCKRLAANMQPKPVDFDRRPGGAVGGQTVSSLDLFCNTCNEVLPNASYLHSHVCKPGSASGTSASAMGTSGPTVGKSAWPSLPDDLPPGPGETRRPAGGWSSFSHSLSDEASTNLPVFYKPSPSSLSSSDSFVSSWASVGPRSSTPVFDAAVRDNIVKREGSQEYACVYCNLVCNTPQAMEAHLSGGKHQKRARRLGKAVSIDDGGKDSIDGCETVGNEEFVRCAGEMVKCVVCDLKLNVNNLGSHLDGKKHAEKKVKSLRAPSCPVARPAMVRSVKLESWTGDDARIKGLLKEDPRRYQWELFVKAMEKDTVVYLPTGTGKTLIAALAIGEMLTRNPHYQAVFLVDKTLLALQQSGYLREQLGDVSVPRFDLGTKEVKRRNLRIACLGGDMHELGGEDKANLWQQDVLVTTVGFYLNILKSRIVSLDTVCLVVMDEAHHCVKEHPFHCLLREYHKQLPPERRAKLLGLTASPAGAATLAETQRDLRTLLRNLGDIEVVATEHATDELAFFTCRNNTLCVLIPMESLERDLQFHLFRFAVELLFVTLPGSPHVASLKREIGSQNPNLEVIPKMLEQQAKECRPQQSGIADLIMDCIDSCFKLESGDWELASVDVEKVCSQAKSFESRGKAELSNAVKRLDAAVTAIKVSNAAKLQVSPVMRFLTKAVEVHLRQSKGKAEGMVLVLVSHRSIAWSVKEYLASHLDEDVACLVGHGSTSGATQRSLLGDRTDLTKGMSVPQQRRALSAIDKKEHRVVVATSVAEEGVDLPACGLVILLSPPSTMSSVVQMRGRARLKNSRLVVLCREEEQRAKFKTLLTRESNMFSAIKEICREQAQRRIE